MTDYYQLAGHNGAFEFFEDRIEKKCKETELIFYKKINE